MAIFFVKVGTISKGAQHGGAAGAVRYLWRERGDSAAEARRYRVHDDLVAKGEHGLPAWARDGVHFFEMAQRYERGGVERVGTVARTYVIALPRDLASAQQREVADDLRTVLMAPYPHIWAIHCPADRDGAPQPHLHVLLNERVQTDGWPRSPSQYFAQAPLGVAKDRSLRGPGALRDLREGVAIVINAALERDHASHLRVGDAPEHVQQAVSAQRLEARGLTRNPVRYRTLVERAGFDAERLAVRAQYQDFENATNLAYWATYKVQSGITDLRREAIRAHVHARFWGRVQTRERQREQERTPERERTVTSARDVTRRSRSWGLAIDDTPQGGVQVQVERDEQTWER